MREMTTREIQMVCLDILKDIHVFCVENDIKYSLSGGSLLGAIRHNGFIPWDDDADIQMPRPDYDRFIHSYKSNNGFKLYSHEIENGDKVLTRIARVCDNERTYVDQGPEPTIGEKVGVWVDVIPVEGAPEFYKDAQRYIKMMRRGDIMMGCLWAKHASIKEFRKFPSKVKRLKFFAKKMIGFFIKDAYIQNYIDRAKTYDYVSSKYMCATPHYRMKEWQPKDCMKNFVLHEFEDTELYIMSGYADNLHSLFGNNYMELPPESKRISHNSQRRYWK